MGIRVTGYQQVTDLSSIVTLTIPDSCNYAVFDILDQAVRWRADGTNPTASVGGHLAVGGQYEHAGNLASLRFLEVTAGAEMNVTYYYRTGGDHQ